VDTGGGGVNFSRFYADVFYGHPLAQNEDVTQQQNTSVSFDKAGFNCRLTYIASAAVFKTLENSESIKNNFAFSLLNLSNDRSF